LAIYQCPYNVKNCTLSKNYENSSIEPHLKEDSVEDGFVYISKSGRILKKLALGTKLHLLYIFIDASTADAK